MKHVKKLENINAELFLKVKEAYANSQPKEFDRTSLDAQLAELRINLQNESLETVRHLLLSNKFQETGADFDARCHFYLSEGT